VAGERCGEAPRRSAGDASWRARTRVIVWCKDCRHQVEPNTAGQARRYGAATPVPDYIRRLICSQCGSRNVDFVLTGARK
jgi:hypothetical protein